MFLFFIDLCFLPAPLTPSYYICHWRLYKEALTFFFNQRYFLHQAESYNLNTLPHSFIIDAVLSLDLGGAEYTQQPNTYCTLLYCTVCIHMWARTDINKHKWIRGITWILHTVLNWLAVKTENLSSMWWRFFSSPTLDGFLPPWLYRTSACHLSSAVASSSLYNLIDIAVWEAPSACSAK